MENKRYFTVAEANQMIPELERVFSRLQQIFPQVHYLYAKLEAENFAPRDQDFSIELGEVDPEIIDNLSTLKLLINTIKAEVEPLIEKGCVIKDVELGIVDWYAKQGGRDIFLCWRYGEKEISYWHDIDEGYVGRKMLSKIKITKKR